MSHTDKDLPYDVRAIRTGHINHNHATGECVVGTYSLDRDNRRLLNAHRGTCARYDYNVVCVHNNERLIYQNKVKSARENQKSYGYHHPDSYAPFYNPNNRSKSSEAMETMLMAGYIPNCIQTKTHTIDIREIDLHLIPGEKVGTELVYVRGTSFYSRPWLTPKIRWVEYNPSIPCDYCDTHPNITCHVVDDSQGKNRYRCSCCSGKYKPYPTRNASREEGTDYAKQYNTFGTVED